MIIHYLLRDFAGTFNKFLFGIGIAGTALEGTSLENQGGTIVTQFLHTILNMVANLEMDLKTDYKKRLQGDTAYSDRSIFF